MSIYRGAGGASDATDDATVNAVAGYASAASTSATNAATSASNAATSASAANASVTSAAASASQAATSASNSAGFYNNTVTQAFFAQQSAYAAATHEGNAGVSASDASTYAASALNAAINANTSAGEAQDAVYTTNNNADNAAASAASALAIYGNTTAMNAAVTASQTAAANAAIGASSSATSASQALVYKDAAAGFASDANASYIAAAASEETASENVALIAGYSASANTAATNANNSALAAASSEVNAAASAAEAAAITGSGSGVFEVPISTTSTLTVGEGALIEGMTVGSGPYKGAANTVFGANALDVNESGIYATALGESALRRNTTGDWNTALGANSLAYNTSGEYNSGSGYGALYVNTTGHSNTATGAYALRRNTIGYYNVAVGHLAASYNLTGYNNTAVGQSALLTNSVGVKNTAIGYSSLFYATGDYNTAVGESAGIAITTGERNTIIGRFTGNLGGLDIRTASNFIVLSDGDGNPRAYWNGANPTFPGAITLSSGTANGISYLNGSKVLTTGTALTFNGATFDIAVSGSTDALRITQVGTGNALLVNDSANPDSTPFVINSGGQTTVGNTSEPWFISGVVPLFGVTGNSNTTSVAAVSRYSNDAGQSWLLFGKSRGAAVGTNTVVQSGDNIGTIDFAGADGTSNISAARITAAVDGIPSTNNMPGRLVFSTTAAGAASPTERMRIDSSGNLGLGVTPSAWSSGYKALQVNTGLAFFADASNSYSITNGYLSTTGFKYVNTNPATYTASEAGKFAWYIAPSGTAGAAITFTQAMTLDASGNLLVGTTVLNAANASGSVLMVDTFGSFIDIGHNTTSTSGIPYMRYRYNGGLIGSISQNGTTAVAYNTSSDYRLKNITGPITTSGAYIDSLKPVEGTWKADGSTFVGLIAHETQEASRTTVATGTKDGEQMQGMDYSSAEIIANLIAELQSLRARVASLESK